MAKLFNRAIQLGGEIRKLGTPTDVTVLEYDKDGYATRARGATVPTDADDGYAIGCLFTDTTGGVGVTTYINEGTSATSADFNAMGSAAAATAYDDIGDPDASGSIAMGAYTGTYTSATANWGGMIISNTHANPTAGAELLHLDFTADGDAHGIYLVCQDNSSADEQFKIAADGATTITGNAAGTASLTQTAGDHVITSGALDINTSTGTAIDVNASAFKVDAATGKISGGAGADIELNTNKFTVDATNGNTLVAGTFDVTGAAALASTLAVTGTSTLTGNVVMSGDLQVDGSLTFGGNWTVGAKLTVDELVLDTDGSIAGLSGSAYVISDNTGDLNLNCLNGKAIHLQENGTDEYDFTDAALDMNANALDNCGYIILNAATAPTGEVMLVNDNTGDLTLNALSGKTINFAINDADEISIAANLLQITAGSDIKFLDDGGILDSNGNEILMVEAVASATTYLNIKNANGAAIELECFGAADKGFMFKNDQNEELFEIGCVASAIDWIKVLPATTGAAPVIQSAGAVDIGIDFETSESEEILRLVPVATAINEITIKNAASGNKPIIAATGTDADNGIIIENDQSEEILICQSAATSVDEITITSAAANGEPIVGATGDDTDITLQLKPKGDAGVNIVSSTVGDAARPDLHLQSDPDSGFFGGTNIVACSTNGTVAWTVDALQNLCVGNVTSGDGTSQGNLYLSNTDVAGGTAPAGAKANTCVLYVEDVAASAELRVIDEAANDTVLSPHNAVGEYIIDSYSGPLGRAFYCELEKYLVALAEKFPEFKQYIKFPKKKKHGLGKK